ncbi:lysozyme [Bartonella sp. 1-1C]|uniref:lysozyme n=1 Tax=Bartonella sp. 1-1C TaxID=515256 RepID=UPI0001F4CAFE|nr:lysozyme [Bartonella sp. 1-1C]ATO56909.1 lysozyme [Bartonella sp. 1-1C]CBI80337.1 Lysozyme [Bartonella sp. 1-1C]
MARKISKNCLNYLKKWEGLRLHAYRDASGIWTIGYGHTEKAGKPMVVEGMVITERKAETMLLTDLRQYERAVEKAVYVDLSDEQFGALVSFCYNIGITAFQNSTLLKKLNKGDYESVPIELQKWTKAGGKRLKGLVHRRAAEAGLWAKSAYVSSNYQLVEKQEPLKILKAEILAPLIASFSGIAELLEGSGPVQWVLATIIVLASCVGLILIAKRLREERL